MMQFNKATIVGGTHGNEFTGVYLLKHWRRHDSEVSRSSFATDLVFGNPKAFEVTRRYVDQDLNRSFSSKELSDANLPGCEANRAKVLTALLRPECDTNSDFILDMHTTTANTGLGLFIVNPARLNFRIAAYVQTKIADAKIFLIQWPSSDQPFLASLCEHGVSVEVGPIPQGLVRHDMLELTRVAVGHILDAIEKVNLGQDLGLPMTTQYYRYTESVLFPSIGNVLLAYVHESLQDRDFCPLQSGDPLFRTFDGQVLAYTGDRTVYPLLINEAGYYDKKVAFFLSELETIPL